MIPLTLSEIATATAGKLVNASDPQLIINHVCTDTRNIQPGCLFIALKGDNFDAHQFLADAAQVGASAIIAHQSSSSTLPTVLVEDTRIALGQLGAYLKSKISDLKCAAITGSNGKTTTKEMLSAILNVHSQSKNSVLATAGNFNNDIGLPLTLLRLTQTTKFAVLELGANHIGEIAYTVNLAKPDVALINNVMPAHLEGFGSIEGVAQAKGEIWSGLSAQGTGVVNLDADFSEQYIAQLRTLHRQLFTFSVQNRQASLFATNIQYDDMGRASFTINFQKQSKTVKLNIAGKHNVSNALAAASMALILGCDMNSVCEGLQLLSGVGGRVNSCKISATLTLIDDTYNANSASLKAAIDLLAQCQGESTLIVADMGELGKYSEQEHRTVGEYAAQKGVNNLLTVGSLTEFTHQSFAAISDQNGVHFADKNSLKVYLKASLQQNNNHKSTILVKGSRSTMMEEIVAYIKQSKIG